MKYDVVVIGAGLGGLTSAATLAKKGKKVLVLEQHFIPGGSATVFDRKGIRCEVGLHEMDWGEKKIDMKHIIFKKLGLFDRIKLITLPQAWRLKSDTKEYTVPEGIPNAKAYLKSQFPEEAQGIDRYFRDLGKATKNNGAYINDLNPLQFFFFPLLKLPYVFGNLFDQSNVGDRLDGYFKSPELKTLIDINLGYYADDPYELSWFYHASAQESYYNSAVFIKGGSQELSNALVDIIKENGGEVRLLADVQKIELDGNRATGVTYQDRKTKEMITVNAKKVIANCAPEYLYNGHMVPKEFNEPKTVGLKAGSSLYTIYVIFKKKITTMFPDMAYSTFVHTDDSLKTPLTDLSTVLKCKNVAQRPFVFVNYDCIDAGLVPEGDERGFGVFCSSSNLAEWDYLSTEDYKAKKEELAQGVINRLDALYPGIKDMIDYYEVSTPKTAKRYLRTPNGTAYGYQNKGFAFRRVGSKFMANRSPRKSSTIKNLYFASAWTFPGGGFTGAILSGYMTAVEMLCPVWLRATIGTILCTIAGNGIGLFIAGLFH